MVAAGTIWIVAMANVPAEKQGQLTTTERVAGAPWWPTKPGVSPTQHAGSATCARCHQRIAESQARTAMARTATRAGESETPGARGPEFRIGDHIHEIRTSNGASLYSVSDGKDRISNVLYWAFGAGRVGQTFLFERNGATYEARASYFDGKRALDVTPGRALDSPVDLEAAIRRPLLSETRRCFACHSTTLTIRDGLARHRAGCDL